MAKERIGTVRKLAAALHSRKDLRGEYLDELEKQLGEKKYQLTTDLRKQVDADVLGDEFPHTY
jgi:hypothetical protein